VANAEFLPLGEDHGARERLLQLADVEGPAVLNERAYSGWSDRHALSTVRRDSRQDCLEQERKVLDPVSERRNLVAIAV
jgi:hypothetical protein